MQAIWPSVFPKRLTIPMLQSLRVAAGGCLLALYYRQCCKRLRVAADGCRWLQVRLAANGRTCSPLQPLAATCSHLQPLAQAATCSHLQPLAGWQFGQVAASDCFFDSQNDACLLVLCKFWNVTKSSNLFPAQALLERLPQFKTG